MKNYKNTKVINKKDTENIDSNILFGGLVNIWLPEEFQDMDEDQVSIKYPYKIRPSVIKENHTRDISMTFDLYEKILETGQVHIAANNMALMIKKVYPYNVDLKLQKFQTKQEKEGYGFSFYIAGDNKKMMEFYILSIHRRFFFGTVCCNEVNKMYFKNVVQDVKKYIQEREIKNKYQM